MKPDYDGSSWIWKEFEFYSKYSGNPLEDDMIVRWELRRPQIHNISKDIIAPRFSCHSLSIFVQGTLQHFNILFSSHHRPMRELLYHHYHFLTDEETDAQRGSVTCPRLHNQEAMDLKFSLTSGSRLLFIPPDYLTVVQAQISTISLTPLCFSYTPTPLFISKSWHIYLQNLTTCRHLHCYHPDLSHHCFLPRFLQ